MRYLTVRRSQNAPLTPQSEPINLRLSPRGADRAVGGIRAVGCEFLATGPASHRQYSSCDVCGRHSCWPGCAQPTHRCGCQTIAVRPKAPSTTEAPTRVL